METADKKIEDIRARRTEILAELEKTVEIIAAGLDSGKKSPDSEALAERVAESVKNCMDCPHNRIVPDPDPTDWFCDDDVAVLCGLAENPKDDPDKAWKSGVRWPNRAITVSCRPYNTRKECATPEWCPKK